MSHTEILRGPGMPALMSGNQVKRGGLAVRLTTTGVRGLLSLAATQSGKLTRQSLQEGNSRMRMSSEDIQFLMHHGLVRERGAFLHITDGGNELARDLVQLANLKGEGAGV